MEQSNDQRAASVVAEKPLDMPELAKPTLDEAEAALPNLMEDYEVSPGEELGAALEEWLRVSRLVANARSRANVKRLLAGGSRKEQSKELLAEADHIDTKETTPLYQELDTITWQIVDILKERPQVRERQSNWAVMPKALRRMAKKGLWAKGVNVREQVARAEAEEEEQERKAQERSKAEAIKTKAEAGKR